MHTQDAPTAPAPPDAGRRWGLRMFLLYLAAYAAFVLTSAFAPALMARIGPAGLTLAVWAGLLLILGAVVLALAYAVIRRHDGQGQEGPRDDV